MVYAGRSSEACNRRDPAHGRGRKKAGVSWWVEDWLSVVESVCSWESASKGRDLARRGNVYDIDVKPLQIEAKVEGASGEEYSVSIACPPMSQKERSRLSSIVRRPEVSLHLLSNELPERYRERLTPLLYMGFRFECDCPDRAKACKHVAAVFYVLAGELDAAPQILFFLRGIDNDWLLSIVKGGMKRKGETGGLQE